ncbi:MAG TPA: succinylglutamate desuccinylase/aspartoacylase family protein [Planctomycetota bacterium]
MKPFTLAGMKVPPGRRKDLRIRISEFYTATPVFLPVSVAHGPRPGPVVYVVAAIHGNEINGIEMVRQVRQAVDARKLRGTLILVMIANPISFLNMSRDLPDGRDLNRFFPGRERGSMASLIADAIFTKIVRHADFGIDLHTAAAGRTNLPHVRADLRSPALRRLSTAFGCEVVFDMPGEEGMLRRAASRAGVPTIVYEAGEPLKFQKPLIRRGVEGILNVLADLKMYDVERVRPPFQIIVEDHRWIRAKRGGIVNLQVKPGDIIDKDEVIAVNTKPFGTELRKIRAPYSGLVVGCTTLPMVIPGSAVCHLVSLGARSAIVRRLLERQALAFE